MPPTGLKCHNCGEEGHFAPQCPQKLDKEKINRMFTEARKNGTLKCSRCGDANHTAIECREKASYCEICDQNHIAGNAKCGVNVTQFFRLPVLFAAIKAFSRMTPQFDVDREFKMARGDFTRAFDEQP